jgi:phosphatidylserine/phosphatidylglycerophosphate/cardiolipin synthase-like enzyme
MNPELVTLSNSDLQSIAAALRSGRLAPPYNPLSLQRTVSPHNADAIARQMQGFHDQGLTSPQIATILDMLLQDRCQRPTPDELIQLVTTGPEAGGGANRDTSVVVRELFSTAQVSVLVAGYAVYQGHRVFRALADRMRDHPHLAVRMFLDVRRPKGDSSSVSQVVQHFADRFRQVDWPPERPLPDVYYFPPSLEEAAEKRAALHARCVVIDSSRVFVSSANFTEAAQERNIEVGVLIDCRSIAARLVQHFDSMVAHGLLLPILRPSP